MAKKKASSITKYANQIGKYAGKAVGEGSKGLGSLIVKGPLGVGEGMGRGLFESFGLSGGLGGFLGRTGVLGYGLNKLNNAFSLTDQMGGLMEGGFEGRKKVMSDISTRNWRKKVTQTLVPQSSFQMEDLVNHSKNLDPTVAEAFKGVDKKKYEQLAADAVKNDNPTAIYDMIVRQAQAKGKKVNLKQPFFLPNVFNRGGKKYAYAIDASEVDDSGKPNIRFVPVPIGGRPFEEPEE